MAKEKLHKEKRNIEQKLVRVIVETDARRESVKRAKEGVYEVSTREPASLNRANMRVREILAEEFGVSVGAVRILAGHQKHKKLMRISIEV